MYDPVMVLREVFGYPSFRPGQEALIRAILSGRDAVGILPTGAGKSLCFSIPALLFPDATVVVTPLVSLMDDQVQQLASRRVSAACLHSGQPKEAQRAVLSAFEKGRVRILFVSPERLRTGRFFAAVRRRRISFLAIDEAHCVLGWGRAFRPAYRKIGGFLSALPYRPAAAAFTATASLSDAEEIGRLLGLRDPVFIRTTYDRPNLFYAVLRPENKLRAAVSFLSGHRSETGIVYCGTRRSVDHLSSYLNARGFPNLPYHAGLSAKKRETAQRAFVEGRIPLIVATCAFGMGIHKDDIRFVLHFEIPPDPESYYQESGRAGRDGADAVCLLLSDIKDPGRIRKMQENDGLSVFSRDAADDRRKADVMLRYASGTACLRHTLLAYFGEDSPSRCGKCSVCRGIPTVSAPTDPALLTNELLLRLRGLRKKIAHEKKVRADRIFSDRNLLDIAEAKPRTLAALLCIEGMPAARALRYGRLFLREVTMYITYSDT